MSTTHIFSGLIKFFLSLLQIIVYTARDIELYNKDSISKIPCKKHKETRLTISKRKDLVPLKGVNIYLILVCTKFYTL